MVNMWSRFFYVLGILIIVGVSHFLVGLTMNGVAILVAGGVECLMAYGLWKLVESFPQPHLDVYLPGIIAIAGIFLGGMLRWLIKHDRFVNRRFPMSIHSVHGVSTLYVCNGLVGMRILIAVQIVSS